jgi:hypothetical protein
VREERRFEKREICLCHGWWVPNGTCLTDSDAGCLAHIVHLAAKHIIQAFSQDGPTIESDFPTDALPANIDDGDLETSYTSGDTLGKLWAFINQV